MQLRKIIFSTAVTLLLLVCTANAADKFVTFNSGDVLLARHGDSFGICVADNDNIGVKIAANNLAADFGKVLGASVSVGSQPSGCRIVVGTLGMSDAIGNAAKKGIIDAKALKGKVEKYMITAAEGTLYIAGSDRRGTIYGIYELSRQLGVSPWYYWMDVPVKKQDSAFFTNGTYTDGEPSVRYRGIFLNDEAPCLTSWVKNTFGTDYGNHDFYEKVFELVLRLKGNYIWPAMWGWAFYANDSLNGKTADDMGVLIGTSHHEPMSRSQQEWKNRAKWDYTQSKSVLDEFWRGGVERNKDTEDIITIGMRGDGDEAMSDDVNTRLLEDIINNQRRIISEVRGKSAKEVPQMWALYKEVMDYYDKGLRVPDDVIILLCDDNWGNVRRVPNLKERKRKGGWGLYYHVDYVGAPRNSKTINVTPVQNMVEQLTLAYENGIDKLWILNVGDLKPMEYPIQLFMDMAWGQGKKESGKWALGTDSCSVRQHTVDFCAETFGEKEAAEAARIFDQCSKLNGRCTPEMLTARTYNLETGEWAQVIDEYKTLEIDALRQYARLNCSLRDAYFQLILFPVQLMANLHQMYFAQAMNNALYKEGDAAMNEWADKCEAFFNRDAELMRQYNEDIAEGKWNGMMVQKHIGYVSWNDDFPKDRLPRLYRTADVKNVFSETDGFVAMEAEHAADLAAGTMVIPGFGRTLSGVKATPGAVLRYEFRSQKNVPTVKVHVITKSTLDYLNKGGMTYSVAIDGGTPVEVNFNGNLNEKPENIYSVYYPTVAARVVEKVVELPLGKAADGTDGLHTLTFTPDDPDIILEKIVVDFGGYKPQYLFGKESPRK